MGGGGSTTTVEKSDPWWGQQNALLDVFQQTGATYNDKDNWPTYYPGNTVAGFNGQQTSALDQLYGLGMDGTTAFNNASNTVANMSSPGYSAATNNTFNTANNTLNDYASGKYLDTNATNPYYQSVVDSTLASTMPGINAQFANGDRLDSGLASRAASEGANSAIGNLNYANYAQQQQNQLIASGQAGTNWNNAQGNQVKAAALAPTYQTTAEASAQNAYNAGQTKQAQAQTEINADVNRYNYNAQLPYNMLSWYKGAIDGSYGGSTTSEQPYYDNTYSQALSTVSSLGGLGLLGYMAFCDARLKNIIARVGTANSGVPLYAFTYRNDPERVCIGPIAQEVQQVRPDAVSDVGGGVLAVDLGKALI